MATWTGRSRGNALGYQIVVYFLRVFGLSTTYFLLRIISGYYYWFAGEPRRVIVKFYQNHLAFPKRKAERLCKQNFFLLAQSILDKIALTMGLGGKIHYTQDGEDRLIEMARSGRGGFLFSAHLGNWDIAGNLLQNLDVPLNVVMYVNEDQQISSFLQKAGSKPKFNIIPIKDDMSHLVRIYEHYKKRELICINADRFLPGAKTIPLPFLNGEAHFPEGPFAIVNSLKAEYAFVFAVKSSRFGYKFSSSVPRKAGQGARIIAEDYVRQLGGMVRRYPEQWFNYYDFFSSPSH
jgi:predicted LPLAT superfamily acyltransferase